MSETSAIVVFTAKSVSRLLREGGTSSWRLDRNNARNCTFAVCTRNANADWVEGDEEHRPQAPAQVFRIGGGLARQGQGLAAQPLLLPVSFKLPKNLVALVEERERLLKRMGLELKSGGRDTMILTRVPALLRQTDLARLLPELLQLVESGSDSDADAQAGVLCQWLVEQGISAEKIYDFATATRLLTELVADFSDQLADVRMVRPLPLANVLAEFADGN